MEYSMKALLIDDSSKFLPTHFNTFVISYWVTILLFSNVGKRHTLFKEQRGRWPRFEACS